MNIIIKNKKLSRYLAIAFLGIALAIAAYLMFLPALPSAQYKIQSEKNKNIDLKDAEEIRKIIEETMGVEIAGGELTENSYTALPRENHMDNGGEINYSNQAFIASTTEDIPGSEEMQQEKSQSLGGAPAAGGKTIVSRTDKPVPDTLIIPKIGVKIPIIESDNEEYGLDHGAWKLPKSSTPEEGGNMILTGHRFKYLPPSNLTFYLFHKLEAGDIASIIWNNKTYLYRIKDKRVVSPDDVSVLKQTKSPTLTMYTCDPIYSTKNRLIITAELIED